MSAKPDLIPPERWLVLSANAFERICTRAESDHAFMQLRVGDADTTPHIERVEGDQHLVQRFRELLKEDWSAIRVVVDGDEARVLGLLSAQFSRQDFLRLRMHDFSLDPDDVLARFGVPEESILIAWYNAGRETIAPIGGDHVSDLWRQRWILALGRWCDAVDEVHGDTFLDYVLEEPDHDDPDVEIDDDIHAVSQKPEFLAAPLWICRFPARAANEAVINATGQFAYAKTGGDTKVLIEKTVEVLGYPLSLQVTQQNVPGSDVPVTLQGLVSDSAIVVPQSIRFEDSNRTLIAELQNLKWSPSRHLSEPCMFARPYLENRGDLLATNLAKPDVTVQIRVGFRLRRDGVAASAESAANDAGGGNSTDRNLRWSASSANLHWAIQARQLDAVNSSRMLEVRVEAPGMSDLPPGMKLMLELCANGSAMAAPPLHLKLVAIGTQGFARAWQLPDVDGERWQQLLKADELRLFSIDEA